MGLYDRDYYREERRGLLLGGDRSMVTNLILVNVAIFLADLFVDGQLSSYLAVRADSLREPWYAWQLLTAGFAHDPHNILHVGFNMFGLWLFGRDVETIYGRAEFLRIYLALVVLSSLAWVVARNVEGMAAGASMVGASGAVTGVMVLYIVHYPRRVFYIWGVIPIPAWVLGALYILQNLLGFQQARGAAVHDRTAYEAHLAGAALAFGYYKFHLNLGRFLPGRIGWPRFGAKPRLRVHDPLSEREEPLNQQVDRILDKIHREGTDSLSASERRTLEDASRRYQRRKS